MLILRSHAAIVGAGPFVRGKWNSDPGDRGSLDRLIYTSIAGTVTTVLVTLPIE